MSNSDPREPDQISETSNREFIPHVDPTELDKILKAFEEFILADPRKQDQIFKSSDHGELEKFIKAYEKFILAHPRELDQILKSSDPGELHKILNSFKEFILADPRKLDQILKSSNQEIIPADPREVDEFHETSNQEYIPHADPRDQPNQIHTTLEEYIPLAYLSELRWVHQIRQTLKWEFDQEFVIDIDDEQPPCVFRVPENLKDTKPEAYEPQQIGLGLYHHSRSRPEFYVLQRRKIAAINRFLEADKSKAFRDLESALVEIQPIIRACYDEYIDVSGGTLALILAIDDLYLLHILLANDHGEAESSVVPEKIALPLLGRNLFMLENQIPCRVLLEIMSALENQNPYRERPTLSSIYLPLCKARSPLILSKREEFVSNIPSPHLLAYMYQLIVNNGWEPPPRHKPPPGALAKPVKLKYSDFTENMQEAANSAAALQMGGAETLRRVAQFAQSVEKIASLLTKTNEQTDEKKKKKIDVPSVSQLQGIAKVRFKKLKSGGIRHVVFKDTKNVLHLPEITFREDSEVILRNLMAYEAAVVAAAAAPDSGRGRLELAEYVDLMCGIVDTDKDVALLKDAGIIKTDGNISDEQIAEIFNGISKSTGKENKENKSKIEKAIGAMRELYDNTCWAKFSKSLKKAIDKSWKFLIFVSTLLVVLLLALQAICSIFDCKRWFGLTANVISLPL